MFGTEIKLMYECYRGFLRKEADILLRLGFPETDVYRGIGIAMGELGKIYTTEGGINVYHDVEGYEYFLARSYLTKLGFYMVKIKDEEDYVCECPSYVDNITKSACKYGKNYKKCAGAENAIEKHCKHIAGAIIVRDFLRAVRNGVELGSCIQ